MDSKSFYNTDEAALHYLENKRLFAKEKNAFAYIPNQSRILDIGCGTGRTTDFFKDRGHDVVGVDISFKMVKTAKSENREIAYSAGDACALSFKDGRFDVVVFSYNGIDYIYHTKKEYGH